MADLLKARTLRRLTAIDERAMPNTYIITDIDVSDDGPQSSTTRTTVGRWEDVSGREAGEDQIRAFGSHRLYMPKAATPPELTSTITDGNGNVYNVVYVFPVQGYSTSRIIGLEDA